LKKIFYSLHKNNGGSLAVAIKDHRPCVPVISTLLMKKDKALLISTILLEIRDPLWFIDCSGAVDI